MSSEKHWYEASEIEAEFRALLLRREQAEWALKIVEKLASAGGSMSTLRLDCTRCLGEGTVSVVNSEKQVWVDCSACGYDPVVVSK